MKRVIGLISTCALLSTSGCTAVLKEVRYPGGYPGYVLDHRTFDASASKQLMLLRTALILAMAAEMSRVTVNGEDADAFAKHLANGAVEINHAAAELYAVGDKGPCKTTEDKSQEDCPGYYEAFEGHLPLIEGRLVRVMLAALPADNARRFLNDASKGNVLGAALNALRTIAKAAGGLHVGAARYRSGLETVATGMSDCYGSGTFDPENQTVIEAAKCLGLSQDKLFAPNPADQRDKLPKTVNPAAFHLLMRNIAAACVALPFTGSTDEIAASRKVRAEACNKIEFKPTPRSYRLDDEGDPVVWDAGADAGTPGPQPAPAPTATPTPIP